MEPTAEKHWPKIDVLEAIRLRRSIRKYLDLPVEWDKIGTIVDAGRVAPSAGNLQSWRFIVVESAHKRRALAEACMQQFWMEEAPVHILVVMMMKKIREFYGTRGTDLYAAQESAMAAQNMMLAAHTLGLGTCFVSAFDKDRVIDTLNLPADIIPMCLVTLGYPNESPEEPQKYRIENVLFMDRWGQQNIARIKDVDQVIWNFRVVERGIKLGNDMVKAVELHTRKKREEITEKVKQKAQEMRDKSREKKESEKTK